jgi:hypothetical protein
MSQYPTAKQKRIDFPAGAQVSAADTGCGIEGTGKSASMKRQTPMWAPLERGGNIRAKQPRAQHFPL